MATDQAQKTQASEDAKKSNATISEYLQAPRKKRKNYVIMAVGEKFDKALLQGLERFVKQRYKALAVSRPKSGEELRRQFGRNISLLILDDNFAPLPEIVDMVEALKLKRKKEVIPILFMTKNSHALIEAYHKRLVAYQEVDDYCDYSGLELKQIFGKVKVGIENQNRRKSRRYKINLDVKFFHLAENKDFKGNLIDLSVHGGLLQSRDLGKFRVGDQLKINIPIAQVIRTQESEFVNISAKVRRVYISGSTAGVSFEHLTDKQQFILVDFVTNLVNYQLRLKS